MTLQGRRMIYGLLPMRVINNTCAGPGIRVRGKRDSGEKFAGRGSQIIWNVLPRTRFLLSYQMVFDLINKFIYIYTYIYTHRDI